MQHYRWFDAWIGKDDFLGGTSVLRGYHQGHEVARRKPTIKVKLVTLSCLSLPPPTCVFWNQRLETDFCQIFEFKGIIFGIIHLRDPVGICWYRGHEPTEPLALCPLRGLGLGLFAVRFRHFHLCQPRDRFGEAERIERNWRTLLCLLDSDYASSFLSSFGDDRLS
jgi:hypothetical protein